MIRYRLCDRAYDCEYCPLDIALRGTSQDAAPSRDARTSVPERVRLNRSHLWIRRIRAGEWMAGLDHRALCAFDNTPQVSLPRAGRRLATGDELLALIVGDEALRWPTPLDVLVLERNDRWTTHPEPLREAPYTAGWMLLLKLSRQPSHHHWNRADVLEQRFDSEYAALRELALSQNPDTASSQATAADGGTLLVHPERLIERSVYLAFLREQWELLPTGGRF